MTELGPILERLGLDQYLDAFLGEGFDTWETLLDIQETDLDALNVKLGHRRKLQREIANFRGIPYERLVAGSPALEGPSDGVKPAEGGQPAAVTTERPAAAGAETKRKYRRHPKPDENAPERPISAYVIFSNKVREEMRGESLSFTALAKLAGDRWQRLGPAQKEPFETQAAAAKERYQIQLSTYKKTDAYKEYVQYLGEFKAKHGITSSDSKRHKLEKESSTGSVSAKSGDLSEQAVQYPTHRRVGSIGSTSSASIYPQLPSPGGAAFGYGIASSSAGLGGVTARMTAPSPPTESPPSTQMAYLPRPAMSNQSSISEDSLAVRGEQLDPLQRPGHLSLLTSTPATSSMSILPPFDVPPEAESSTRPSRLAYLSQQQESLAHVNAEPYSYRSSVPSSHVYQHVAMEDSWRGRMADSHSHVSADLTHTVQPPTALSPAGTFGALPLPPHLLSDQSHRTLPVPHSLSRQSEQHDVRGVSRAASSPGSVPALDRSESEAVNTLAGLSGRGGRGGPPRSSGQRHPGQ